MADTLGDEAGGLQDAVEANAVRDAKAVEQVQQVFGRDVAGGTRAGKGTATQAAGRAIELVEAEIQAGQLMLIAAVDCSRCAESSSALNPP